jgi:type 1 glutamine amidotransferase
VLLFGKMTGFRDGPSVAGAETMVRDLVKRNGWALAETLKGGAINAVTLAQFDVIVWNNISGDVLTLTQREALKTWMEHGGGFVAMHGSGGDPIYWWDWYVDKLIGARFNSHPMAPQFQEARVNIEPTKSGIGNGLGTGWVAKDEWYSFKQSARLSGAHVIATLDEKTYSPIGRFKQDLRMGSDHPIAWTRCVGNGRSYYSAIGHRPEMYVEPNNVRLMEQAISWAAGKGTTYCANGVEIANKAR